jgi:HEAT repeat protein
MRIVAFAILMVGAIGCGKAQPTLAGGKPVSYWVEATHNPDPRVRKQAVFKLGNVGPTDPAALPAVTEALKDTDAGVRRVAILALVKFGGDARSALPVLTELRQRDRDAQVRSDAAKALDRIQAER